MMPPPQSSLAHAHDKGLTVDCLSTGRRGSKRVNGANRRAKNKQTWYTRGVNKLPFTLRQQPRALRYGSTIAMPNSTRKCKKCGTTERYKNGRCAQCSRERSRKWHYANPDKVRASSRKWKQANPDKVRAIHRKWRQANPDKVNAKIRKWQQANRDKERIRKRKWKQANPDKRKADNHRRRALKRQAKSEPYNFKAICNHYKNVCLKCGKKGKLTVDHIKPLSLGGNDIASNIQPLCHSCNASKGARNIDYRPDAGPLRWFQKKLFSK